MGKEVVIVLQSNYPSFLQLHYGKVLNGIYKSCDAVQLQVLFEGGRRIAKSSDARSVAIATMLGTTFTVPCDPGGIARPWQILRVMLK